MARFSLKLPHLSEELQLRAVTRLDELYSAVVANWPGFIEREGQLTLMQKALEVLLSAKTDTRKCSSGENLAILEAGTGTGKTLGYCLAAIVASEILNMKVVVSTATITLQEQLFHKDLPILATFIPDLSYDLLKGRGRYVCKSKLELALGGEIQGDWLDMEEEFTGLETEELAQPQKKRKLDERTVVWLHEIQKGLDHGSWSGEIDSLGTMPDEAEWKTVQADVNACSGGRCEHFKSCSFFAARRKAQAATIQVANHSLVLATLAGESTLINASESLFVFDESHQLPEIAADQFSYRTRLGQGKKILSALIRTMARGTRILPEGARPNLMEVGRCIKQANEKFDLLENYIVESDLIGPEKPIHRFEHGVIAGPISDECQQLGLLLTTLEKEAIGICENLLATDESVSPKERNDRASAANEIGPHLSRLTTQKQVFKSWATHDKVPLAKWIEFVQTGDSVDALLCVSPLTGAQGLIKGLWNHVAGAVCTSATLSACGSFEFFERLSGLNRYPDKVTGIMPSPFDYEKQGVLRLPKFKNTPKATDAFSLELCQRMPELLSKHSYGQLVLFTSNRQMNACYEALPDDLKTRVLVQKTMSRQYLLKEHRQRVADGEPSIIYGLQSMGEGLDLPGRLCEHVIIDKLPFAPPSSPVDQALGEWLSSQGRDAFDEIIVPRTAMRLAQWVGRGVRTVDDFATITICDTRLSSTRYGRRILNGLPAFSRE